MDSGEDRKTDRGHESSVSRAPWLRSNFSDPHIPRKDVETDGDDEDSNILGSNLRKCIPSEILSMEEDDYDAWEQGMPAEDTIQARSAIQAGRNSPGFFVQDNEGIRIDRNDEDASGMWLSFLFYCT